MRERGLPREGRYSNGADCLGRRRVFVVAQSMPFSTGARLSSPKNLKPRVPAPAFLRAYSACNKNEYLRNILDVRDGTDELHWFRAMAQGRRWSLILHYSLNFRSLGFDLGAGGPTGELILCFLHGLSIAASRLN